MNMRQENDRTKIHRYIGENTTREVARLIRQQERFAEADGPTLSSQDWQHTRFALDIGCGPGGWVLDTAQAHPRIEKVIGIDISPRMLSVAESLATVGNVQNAHFVEMDVTQRLDFPDGYFHLVNARLVNSFLSPEQWPHLLSECVRVLDKGGTLWVTEYEAAYSNSLAVDTLTQILFRGLMQVKRSFSPSGMSVGIAFVLPLLFKKAGLQDVSVKGICLDASHSAEGHQDWREDMLLMAHSFRSFVIAAGVTTDEEVEHLLEQAQINMKADDFCSLVFNACVWGTKL